MLDLHFWPTPNGKKVTILFARGRVDECFGIRRLDDAQPG